jgi:hypothetical protein
MIITKTCVRIFNDPWLRLLLFLPLLLLFADAALFPQADEGKNQSGIESEETQVPLEMQIETSSANPLINNPWSIFILVNHPNPQELSVTPPRFPLSLALERVRTEIRVVSGNERWTRVEFLFTPLRGGAITIDPFEVVVSGRKAYTAAFVVNFREPVVRRYEPRFRWAGSAPPVHTGKKSEAFLELAGWDPDKKAPQGVFQGKAPRNAILEEGPPVKTGEGAYSYKIIIIPLEEDSVVLEPFLFQAERYSLAVPGRTVPVLPAPRAQSYNPEPETAAEDSEAPQGFLPKKHEKVFPLFRQEYNRITAAVYGLWEEGRRAEALAEIRKNERDSFAGLYLVPLRMEMEQALNLGFTEDEKRRPLRIPFLFRVILGFSVFSAGAILFIFRPFPIIRKKSVTSRRYKGFRTVIAVIVLAFLVLIFLDEGLDNFPSGRFNSAHNAVLEKTQAYRVPDYKGAVSARFSEGQPVIVGDYMGGWCYAESPDGRSGWVPREAVIIY